MKRPQKVLAALLFGCVAEAILCAVAIVSIFSGGFGPCGPSGDFPRWLVVIHQPGIWLSEGLLPEATFARLAIIVGTTAAELSIAALVFIELGWLSAKERGQ